MFLWFSSLVDQRHCRKKPPKTAELRRTVLWRSKERPSVSWTVLRSKLQKTGVTDETVGCG